MKILWLLGMLIGLLIATLVMYIVVSSWNKDGNAAIEYRRDNIGDQSSGLRDRSITLDAGNYSARGLFDSIEKRGSMYFSYRHADIPDSFRIIRKMENISIQHTLELISLRMRKYAGYIWMIWCDFKNKRLFRLF
ncbi:hypothetical protein [Chitinophaga niabensis]|uniref:Uncharacterized protein n=1 Tax=Chitinophaga niabensis TaxID=536979 RepID=A0A1N6E305_9BACT|nr:hypothetical protein [Chitinophaga niabensis]SIN77396.1 hypothetical protein SAMN04488055_1265 [Chitinophaga niabensis]